MPIPEGTDPGLHALYLALRAAFARSGSPWPEAIREPLGAVGGGPAELRAAIENASGVSTDGHPIDELEKPS